MEAFANREMFARLKLDAAGIEISYGFIGIDSSLECFRLKVDISLSSNIHSSYFKDYQRQRVSVMDTIDNG